MIKTISVRELRPNISKVLNDIHEKFDRYIISRRGKPEAIIMSIEDYEGLLETIEIESDKELMTRLKRAEKDIKEGRTISFDELKEKLGDV